MDKFDFWRLCDELSVVQAALLIIGEDPNDYPNILDWRKADNTFCPPSAIDSPPPAPDEPPPRRIDFSSMPDFPISDPTPDPPFYPPRDFLRYFSATFTAITNAINGNRLTAKIQGYDYGFMDPSPNEDTTDWYNSTIIVDDLRIWLKSRGINSGFFFPDALPIPDYLNPEYQNYSPKLAAAVRAWEAVATDTHYRKSGKSIKNDIIKWLYKNAENFGLVREDGKPNKNAIENQIAKVANFEYGGGAPTTPGGK
jgi:hypothetical protein